MTTSTPYDLVIFDCDGVLIDSEIISARMLIEELARLGVVIDLDHVARHFLGRSYPTVMAQIRKDFDLNLPPEFEDRYRDKLLEAFSRDLKIMPGVLDVLDELSVPYCLATSSSPRRVDMSLLLTGLSGRMEGRVFTASQVARGKPAPDLFLFAAAQLGHNPSRTLVIEDSLTGVRAALAAGMTVWRYVGGSHFQATSVGHEAPADALPHRQFDDFATFFHTAPGLRRGT